MQGSLCDLSVDDFQQCTINLSRSKTIASLPSCDTAISPASFHNHHPTFLQLKHCVTPIVSPSLNVQENQWSCYMVQHLDDGG